MASTILLDVSTWDLVLDASGNIAVASEPYSLAQDAASYGKTFLGEVYFDTTLGIPYLTQVLGKSPSPALIKQLYVDAALEVPDVASAQFFVLSFTDRILGGQIQVWNSNSAEPAAATFSVANPQGVG